MLINLFLCWSTPVKITVEAAQLGRVLAGAEIEPFEEGPGGAAGGPPLVHSQGAGWASSCRLY